MASKPKRFEVKPAGKDQIVVDNERNEHLTITNPVAARDLVNYLNERHEVENGD